MATIRIILHGEAAADPRLRAAVETMRTDGHGVEVRVTWEPGDATRLTAEAVAQAAQGNIDCIVAGGGDGTINEVFAAAYAAGLPAECALGILPLGTANDFAHSAGVRRTGRSDPAIPLSKLRASVELYAQGKTAMRGSNRSGKSRE